MARQRRTWIEEDGALLLLVRGGILDDSDVRRADALVRPVKRHVEVPALERVTVVAKSLVPVRAR